MKSGVAFGLGILIGTGLTAVVANTILKQQYEQKADEEIVACREAFLEELKRRRDTKDKDKSGQTSEEKKEAAVEAAKTYTAEPTKIEQVINDTFRFAEKEEPKPPKNWKLPYVIDPAIFDSPSNGNKTLGLKYYPEDGVVARAENDEAVTMEELDRMVGRDALTHFGEFDEEDRVCVRNDNWGVDYEILIQPTSYKEVLKEKPWLKK